MRAPSAPAVALVVALAAAAAACETPPLRVRFDVSSGPSQPCVAAGGTCADVSILCDAVFHIRVISADQPNAPHLSMCTDIPLPLEPDRRNLCPIAALDLPAERLPRETLEVQAMVWPRHAVGLDPESGELDCREINGKSTTIAFDLNGFPVEAAPSPALGGHAYYQPGDEETVITLGCSDVESVQQPACFAPNTVSLVASVNDFDSPTMPVRPVIAGNIEVSIGTPAYDNDINAFVLGPSERINLEPVAGVTPRTWSKTLTGGLGNPSCIQVDEDSLGKVASVRCRATTPGEPRIEYIGMWLDGDRLDTIRNALFGVQAFPMRGLTVGILLGDNGMPAKGHTISASGGATVKYLSADGSQLLPEDATATADGGLFIATDAPFGTVFSALGPQAQAATGIGGLIQGKVTIVVMRFSHVAS